MKKFLQKTWVKNVSSILAVPIFGMVLLNVTFIFDALYQSLLRVIVNLIIPLGPESYLPWLAPFFHGSFVVIIGIISWLVLKSKLKTVYKAIYIVVPQAVVLATLGILLYRWPALTYSVGILECLAVLYFLYREKKPWIYYYSVILISIMLAIFTLVGGEI